MSSDRLTVFDTTLRDGEQAPGFSMRIDEKLKMARQLAALGVDIMEAGFPIASDADAEAVRVIATDPWSCHRRAGPLQPKDIGAPAGPCHRRRALHVFIATSDLHLEQLRMTRENVCGRR
jgi:2-isopropylmalate synthase